MTLTASSDARTRARLRWSALADRLRTVTPEAIGRAVLTTSIIVLGTWGVVGSWPALLPFVGGVVLAYAVLPIANRLDAFMPRVLAALIAELIALAILVGVVVVVIPPVLVSAGRIVGGLPTPEGIQAALANAQAQLGELPEPLRSIVVSVATQTVANLQSVVDGFITGIADFATQQILQIAGTVSFVLGLLVIPVWVLTIVADEGAIRRRAGRLVAPAIRADVFAIARIVDRAFGTFLRIRVLLAIVVSVFIVIGVEIAASLGIGTATYAVGIATLLGVLQLIPELGFFLGFFPLLLILAVAGPAPFLAAVIIYVVAVRLASGIVETRVSRGVLDVHPGLLIPAIVVLSQIGPLWLLVAAPFIAIVRDIVRYLAGRLAEPPQPAGVLPGDRRSRDAAARAAATPVPTVYRTAAATPRAASATPRADAASGTSRPTIPRLQIPSFTAAVPFGPPSAGASASALAGTPAGPSPGAPVPVPVPARAPERSPIP